MEGSKPRPSSASAILSRGRSRERLSQTPERKHPFLKSSSTSALNTSFPVGSPPYRSSATVSATSLTRLTHRTFHKSIEECRLNTRICDDENDIRLRPNLCQQLQDAEEECETNSEGVGKQARLVATSKCHGLLSAIHQQAKSRGYLDLTELCQRKQKMLDTTLRRVLKISPKIPITHLVTTECGGELSLIPNFASGAMSTLMRVTGKDLDIVAKPLCARSAPTDPMVFSGIPEEHPRFGIRSRAFYETAHFLGQTALVPGTQLVLVNGIPCLAQDFVEGEEALHTERKRVDASDLTDLIREIENKQADLGQHFEMEDHAKQQDSEVFTHAQTASYRSLAMMLLDGKLENSIHIQIIPEYIDELSLCLETHNIHGLSEMFRARKVHLNNHDEFLAGLARSNKLYRIHKIAQANLNIDFATPEMQRKMAIIHILD